MLRDSKGEGGELGEGGGVIISKYMGEKARKRVEKLQLEGAIGHWRVMRGVLPATVWENW